MIRYLKHNEIDKVKWDECIEGAENKLIYALSWYLDIVSPNWDALISDDYESVMPLPNRSKWGIRYIFTPRFIQQLGVIGKRLNDELVNKFFTAIPSFFKLVELSLNENNESIISYSSATKKINYKLNLEGPYSEIQRGYSRNCNRNIIKAKHAGLITIESKNSEEYSEFIKIHLEKQISKISSNDFNLLHQITKECLIRKKAEIVYIQNKSGETVAAGSFLLFGDRVIFTVCASSPEGKANQAMHLLVNSQIEKHAGNYKWFDFSGSNIKGVAYFNSTFGAEIKEYPFIILNRLNWFEKLFSGKFR